MKHLVVFTVLVVSCFGRGEVDGIFKDTAYFPKTVREENVWAPRLGRDCSPPTVEDCRGDSNMHPYPCDCHKYFQCAGGILFEKDCDPHFLIFNPYPGNCHWYYECVHQPNDPYCEWISKGPYDCGDWAFNPEQSSCTWPELVPSCT